MEPTTAPTTMSEAMRQRWQNPEYKERVGKAISRALILRHRRKVRAAQTAAQTNGPIHPGPAPAIGRPTLIATAIRDIDEQISALQVKRQTLLNAAAILSNGHSNGSGSH